MGFGLLHPTLDKPKGLILPMKENRPPLPLMLVAAGYLVYLAWKLVVDFTPDVLVRFGLSVILFFFIFQGSRVAGNILAMLCTISAIMSLVVAFTIFTTNIHKAAMFSIISTLLLAFSAYMIFNPAIRKSQKNVKVQ